MITLFVVIAMALLALLFATFTMAGNEVIMNLTNYADITSLLLVIFWTLPVLIGAGMLKDFGKSFGRAFSTKKVCTREELVRSMEAVKLTQKSNWVAGILGFISAFIYICRRFCFDEIDAQIFVINVAVASITLFYAAIINLVLLAVYGRLKKRYIEYMQDE